MTLSLSLFEDDLRSIVRVYPHSTAIIDSLTGKEWSYLELDLLLNKCGVWLALNGVRRNGAVVNIMPNCVECIVIFLSCLRFGISYAPLPFDAKDLDIKKMRSLISPALTITVFENNVVQESTIQSNLVKITNDGSFSWLYGISMQEQSIAEHAGGAKVYLMTSGTTGKPKLMVIDSDTLWCSAKYFMKFHSQVTRKDRFINIMPMSYLGGLYNLCLIPISIGASIVIAEPLSGLGLIKFWKDVSRYKVTILWLVPTLIRALVLLATERNFKTDLQDLRKFAFLGTAPITPELKREFEVLFGIRLIENYALSETTFISSEQFEITSGKKTGVGEILPYVNITFRENTNKNEFKEIGVKTPFLFDGYLDESGKLSPPQLEGGFFFTGDIGNIEDKILQIKGRVKDIIKKAGVLIILSEIEAILLDHPKISQVATIGIAHHYYGEDYIVFCQLKDKSNLTSKTEILEYLYDRIIRAKWPLDLLLIETIPYTKSGKIRKGELENLYKKSEKKDNQNIL